MTPEIWDIAIHPRVVITASIVVGFFLPLLYSVYKTWEAAKEK
jgi:hypothetical protein